MKILKYDSIIIPYKWIIGKNVQVNLGCFFVKRFSNSQIFKTLTFSLTKVSISKTWKCFS